MLLFGEMWVTRAARWTRTGARLLLAAAPLAAARHAAAAEVVFPLRVDASGRHLQDRQGEPFFVNGEAAWSLAHNLTFEEAARYLEDRKARGINAVLVSVPDAFAPDGT